jgi:esterase/lipase
VHGLADEMVPTKNAQHIAQLLPQAQLNLLEGADHRFTQHTAQREDLSIQWLAGHWGDTGQL